MDSNPILEIIGKKESPLNRQLSPGMIPGKNFVK
jgi:hypothetical protein